MITMEEKIKNLKPIFDSIKWENDKAYALWLSQAYYIARKSTSFLGITLFHADKHPEFQARCTEHIAEETGHEKLIINDLKNIGYSSPLPELPETSAVYQTQYYRIVAENPLSFLGYVFFLELLAPEYGPYVIHKISNKSSTSFLRVHSKADEIHIEEAYNVLNSIKDEKSKEQIISNFDMTLTSYVNMLNKISIIS